MAAMNTSTFPNSAVLDERIKDLRAKLRSTQQGHRIMQKLAPVGIVKTDPHNVDFTSHDIIDFTDWQQWSQWPQSY